MIDQTVIQSAIMQAIAHGWFPHDLIFDCVSDSEPKGYAWTGRWERYQEMLANGNLPPDHHPEARLWHVDPKTFLYTHDFAKSLWGEEEHVWNYGNGEYMQQVDWKYHLQMMIVADDYVEYLENNT